MHADGQVEWVMGPKIKSRSVSKFQALYHYGLWSYNKYMFHNQMRTCICLCWYACAQVSQKQNQEG